MSTTKYLRGSIATICSTDLNSLANNARVLSAAAVDNSTALDLMAEFELVTAAIGVAFTANTGFSIYLLRKIDGTNYEDGSTSITPARAPDLVLPVRAVTGAQRIIRPAVIPPGAFNVLIINDGTGQALASSGNTLKLIPLTYSQV